MNRKRAIAALIATLVNLSHQLTVDEDVWRMTRSFVDLFHAKDMVFYYDKKSPSLDLIMKSYKNSSDNTQFAMVNISDSELPVLPKGPQVTLVKFMQTSFDQNATDKVVALSTHQKWTFVNVWLIGLELSDANRTIDDEIIEVRALCDQLDLQYMSQVYVYIQSGGMINLYEAYKISQGDPEAEVLYYGYWSQADGLEVDEAHIWHRRANLRGKHLRISALLNKPYETMVVDGCQGPECFQGMFADVFHELMYMMNFTYTMMMPKDGQWGAQRDDGSWTGVIGQLAEGEVDVSAADFRITAARIDVVDFLPTLDDPHLRLFIANPADSFNWYAYVRPFPMLTWTVIILILLISPPAISVLITLGNPEDTTKDFSIMNCYGFVSGSIALRDFQPAPNAWRGRVAFFTVMFFGLNIYYHWEAMIISYLAMRTTPLPFNSLQELLDDSDYKIVVQYGTAFVDGFRYSPNPLYKRAWDERMEPYLDQFPLTKDGMTDLIHADTTFAMFDNYNTRIYYDDFISCKTVDIPKEYFQIQYAMPIAKDLPYFEAMWFHTINLKERGTLMQIKDRYRNEPQVCPDLSGEPLGFNQTFTAFLVLMWGLFAAAVLFGGEFLCRPKMLEKVEADRLFEISWKGRIKSSNNHPLLEQLNRNEEDIRRMAKANRELRERLGF